MSQVSLGCRRANMASHRADDVVVLNDVDCWGHVLSSAGGRA